MRILKKNEGKISWTKDDSSARYEQYWRQCKRERNWLEHCFHRDCTLKYTIEGVDEGRRERGRTY